MSLWNDQSQQQAQLASRVSRHLYINTSFRGLKGHLIPIGAYELKILKKYESKTYWVAIMELQLISRMLLPVSRFSNNRSCSILNQKLFWFTDSNLKKKNFILHLLHAGIIRPCWLQVDTWQEDLNFSGEEIEAENICVGLGRGKISSSQLLEFYLILLGWQK